MVIDKNDSWGMHKAKAHEECLELIEAINENDELHIAEEALDNIQVSIGILDKLSSEGVDIQTVINKHNKKLINRGWKSKITIKVQLIKG
jgi:NTP pyrophosphatase (non-canonical NTP hydrolase)